MTRNKELPAPIELDEESLGPAMRLLNPRQRLFVVGKVAYGLTDTEAAKFAGYQLPRLYPNGFKQAYRVAHHPAVQEAILEEGRKLMRAEGAKSIRTLVEIRDDEQVDAKDRMKAAIELLNRSGFHAVSEHHMSVEHHLSEGEMDRRMLSLAAELGLPEAEARKLLIAPTELKKNAEGIYEPEQNPEPKEVAPSTVRTRRFRARQRMAPEEAAADKAKARAEQSKRAKAEYKEAQRRQEIIDVETAPIDDEDLNFDKGD